VKTQVRVLRRVVNVAVGILAVALMLTQFEAIRNIGVSLLASAGVAGVVLGFAAQRTIGSLIASIQLSFTQPIRIGDVVIVEKEWGTIEEVTLTFVVVRVWDDRRLIIPMSRFLEQPFENWTMLSPQLHGTIFFHVDWRLPIDDLRRELDRVVENNPLWDGRTKSVCVTNTSDRTIEVRALVSAKDADDLWKLRVLVRERIVAWLQGYEGEKYLPRIRIDERVESVRSA
jgi:small-conductance mechanosensitive channel